MIWNGLFILGMVLGLFLAVILLLQAHTNRSAARLAAGVLSLIALGILLEILAPDLPARWTLLLNCININTELALGPLIYLLVRSVTYPERQLRPRDVIHFLPMLAGMAVWTLAWSRIADPQAVFESDFSATFPVLHFLAFKALVMFAYLGSALALLKRAIQAGRRYTHGRRPVELRRLRGWLLALCLVPMLIYGSVIAEVLVSDWTLDSDAVSGLLLTAIVLAVLAMLLMRPWLLSVHAHRPRPQKDSHDGRRLLAELESAAPWREPDLDLPGLAARLGWSENHLSRVINHDLGSNFYALVGEFRLAEFERLARLPSSQERPVLDLAMEAGFNSKASFYRAFRQRHGATTPAAFKASIASP